MDSFDLAGKAELSNMNFLNNLKNYDKDAINDEYIELLYPYLS